MEDGYRGGWGPERELFTAAAPAPYALLNSATDNQAHGDERNFAQGCLVDSTNESYTDRVGVEPGDTVVIYAAVSNDAADNLAGSPATLHGLVASMFPHQISRTAVAVGVQLGAKNARDVWDGVQLVAAEDIEVEYVSGSAFFHTAHESEGFAVADLGVQPVSLGFARPDGEFPVGLTSSGMERGYGYLTFRVDVVAAT